MSYHSDSVKERIIEEAVKLICDKLSYDIKLFEISEATGITAPVLYNYFSGIEEINREAFNKIQKEIMAISNLKFPGSVTPEMKIVTIGFNLIKHFEETGFPLGFLTEEKDTLPVDLTELKKNLKLLFEKVPGILYEPALSVNIFLSHLAANISYYKKRKLKVPDNVAEKAFMIILKI